MRPIRKVIYTLNIGDYAPEICALTYPFMRRYAQKIGAEFHVITERKFPDWPVVYEKLQIQALSGGPLGGILVPGKQCRIWPEPPDWSIYIDSDALINPEMFCITEHIAKDTVCHNGRDMNGVRWKMDQYFRRDGRWIGSCNWFTIASDWCLDLWRPLDDLTFEQALENIYPTVGEHNSGECKREHLIDDYTLSRNIARFGLKFTTVTDICAGLGWRNPQGGGISPFLWHKYTLSTQQKVKEMLAVLSTPSGQPAFAEQGDAIRAGDGSPVVKTADGRIVGPCGGGWGLMDPQEAAEFRQKWNIR